MKKLIALWAMLLMFGTAFAEGADAPALPVKTLARENAAVTMEAAMTAAQRQMAKAPTAFEMRTELVELADGTSAWVVTTFDTADVLRAWTVLLDAGDGHVLRAEETENGFFGETYADWTAQKGIHALWSMEDKQLYDALYAMLPSYGLPQQGDMSAEAALAKALAALGLDSADGYSVGYGYLMGGEGYNGVWEISLIVDGTVDCQVNLDAVSGEICYLMWNQQASDDANG